MDKVRKVGIRKIKTSEEAEVCARMMSGSEPWITLKRDFKASLKMMNDPLREVYVARSRARILGETSNVFIMVSSFNDSARRLYERRGYEVVGELKDLIVSGYSEILMRKTMGPTADFLKGQPVHR